MNSLFGYIFQDEGLRTLHVNLFGPCASRKVEGRKWKREKLMKEKIRWGELERTLLKDWESNLIWFLLVFGDYRLEQTRRNDV